MTDSNASKISGLKPPSHVSASSSSAHAKSDPQDDPIAQSLEGREKLGGIGSYAKNEAEAKKHGIPIYKLPLLRDKGATLIDFVAPPKSASVGPAAKSSGLKRPTARTSALPKVSAISSHSSFISNADESNDCDDPIAISMQIRIKAGAQDTVLKELDIKKLKVDPYRPKKLGHKATAPTLIDFTAPSKISSASVGRTGTSSPTKRPVGRPSTSVGIKPIATSKPSVNKGSIPSSSQLDGDLAEDPVAQALLDRVTIGGFSANCSDLEAKKKGITILRAPKLPAKGVALIDLLEAPKGAAVKKPAAVSKPAPRPSKVTHSVPKVTISNRDPLPDLKEDLSDDPIGASLRDRLVHGKGYANHLSDLDCKKKKLQIPAVLKLKTKDNNLQDFTSSAAPSKASSAQLKVPGASSKGKSTASRSTSAQKKRSGSAQKKQGEEADPTDPIQVSLKARKDSGTMADSMNEQDARRKKVAFPKALKLNMKNSQLLTLVQEETATSQAEGGSAAPGKSTADDKDAGDQVDYATDPIDYTMGQRKKAGGLSSTVLEADAKRKNISVPQVKKLQVKVTSSNAALIDFKPAASTKNDDEFKGFVKLEDELRAKAEEEARIAQEKADEEARVIREKQEEQERIAKEKADEEARVAQELADEEARVAQEKADEEARVAKEKADEEARIAQEKADEEARIAKEQADEEARIAQEKADEEAKIAKEKADAERTDQEKADEEARVAQEKADEEARVAQEKIDEEARVAKEKADEEARIAQEKADQEALELKVQQEKEAAEKAEKEGIEAAQAAEEARIAQEKADKEAAEADEAKAEQERLEKEAKESKDVEEKARLEQEAAEAKVKADKEQAEAEAAAEQARIEKENAEKEAAEAEAARVAAEEARIAKEQAEEEARVAAEKAEQEAREAEEARLAAEKAEQEAAAIAEAERIEKEEAERKELEQQAAEEEARQANELAKAEAAAALSSPVKQSADSQPLTSVEKLQLEQQEDNEEQESDQIENTDRSNELEMFAEGGDNELSALEGEYAENDLLSARQMDGEFIQADDSMTPRVSIDESHQNLEEEIKKEEPLNKPPVSDIQIDFKLIVNLWPYVRPGEQLPSEGRVKSEGGEMAQEMLIELELKMKENQDKIDETKKSFPDAEGETIETDFALTSMTTQGLEILQDIPVDYDDWVETAIDETWVIRTLKLWFFMQKNFSIVHKWASWPDIFNDTSFMKKAVKIVEDIAEELDTYLPEKVDTLIFDDIAHLAKLECLLEHLGGEDYVDPHHEETDSSVGTFIMFVLRDALEYAGLLPQRKRMPARELRLYNFKKTFFEQQEQALKTALGGN